MSARPETMRENDVVELLLAQHEEIRRLFTGVKNANHAERAEFPHIKSAHSNAAQGDGAHAPARRYGVGHRKRARRTPYAAMLDRARDVVRRTLRQSSGED